LYLAGALCLAGGSARVPQANAQAPAESAPVIRTEARLVLVDAVVTDKKGTYVRDLTAKDFRVWEDGAEQTLKSFSFEAEPASSPNAPPRYLVLFFDNSTMKPGEQVRARQAAAKFIDSNAGPKRLIAIVNYGGSISVAQNFTADSERLKQAVAGVQRSVVSTNTPSSANSPELVASAGMPPIGRAELDFGIRSMLLAVKSMAKNLASVPGRKTMVLFSSGFLLTPEYTSELTAAINACNKANVAVYPVDVRGLVADTSSLPPQSYLRPAHRFGPFAASFADPGQARGGGGSAPAPAPAPGGSGSSGSSGGTGGKSGSGSTGGTGGGGSSGGKGGSGNTGGGTGCGLGNTCVAYGNNVIAIPSTAFRLDIYSQARTLIPQFPKSVSTNQEVLYALATGTGGFVIANTNDLLGGLERIGREQDEYYMLGYSPAESAEGSCHTLKVKVARGGTEVRARSGYCNVKPADLLAGTPIEKALESHLAAAASQAGSASAFMELPFFYSSRNTARVNLAMEIPLAGVKPVKSKGKLRTAVDVLGVAYAPDGAVAARFSDTVNLEFSNKKEWEQFAQQPLHYEDQVEMASGQYNLKLVFSAGGENFGKVEAPLVIDPWDATQFSLSGIALSDQIYQMSETTAGLDAALLEDRVPLVTRGLHIIPSGDNRFKSTDKAVAYVEIYEPPAAGANPPAVEVRLQFIDRKTGETKVDSGSVDVSSQQIAGSSVIPLGLRLPLEKLTPGSYKVELTATDSAGNSSEPRHADFELE
jgi:VWFA-related protein